MSMADMIMYDDTNTTVPSTHSLHIPYIDSQYHYCVTQQQSTAVTHALYNNICTQTHNKQLILAKNTHIELYVVLNDLTLELLVSLPIYGRIVNISVIPVQPTTSNTNKSDAISNCLFVLCENGSYCMIQYDIMNKRCITLHSGTIQHNTTALAHDGPFVLVDTKSRCLLIHLYTGIIQYIDIQNITATQHSRTYTDIRIDYLTVKGMTQNRDTNNNICISLLICDNRHRILIKQYELKHDKSLITAVLLGNNVSVLDPTTSHIVSATQYNSTISIAQNTITCYSNKSMSNKHGSSNSSSTTDMISCNITPTRMTTIASTNDSNRYLCSDLANNLYIIVLTLNSTGTKVQSIACEYIGQCSVASCIVFIDELYDNTLLYIGSYSADNQLIKLNTEPDTHGSYLSIIHTQQNIGPIKDGIIVYSNDQPALVTCSGTWRNGTLRIIKQGISINIEAEIELDNVTTLYSLHNNTTTYLLVSFIEQTRILATDDNDEMSELTIDSIITTQPTIYATSDLLLNIFIQVTNNTIQLIDGTTLQLISQYDIKQSIVSAQYMNKQLLVGAGTQLMLFTISDTSLTLSQSIALHNEISCISLYSHNHIQLCGVGLWQSNAIQLYSIPALQHITAEHTPNNILPRSILIVVLDTILQLFIGLGDGKLNSYTIEYNTTDSVILKNQKLVQIGTQPLFLTLYTTPTQQTNIFISCDKPCILISQHNKLLYNPVHQQYISTVCTYNTPSFGSCLVFATKQQLIIGRVDSIQKLHINTIELHDEPVCIQYSVQCKCYIVGCISFHTDQSAHYQTQHIRIYDDTAYNLLSSTSLNPNEAINCIKLIKLSDITYICVGTADVVDGHREPTTGRILLYELPDHDQLHSNKSVELKLFVQHRVHGSVNTVDTINDRIVCGINHRVEIYEMKTNDIDARLEREVVHRSHVNVIKLHVIDSYIIIADSMSSLKLLLYKSRDTQHSIPALLEQIACDYTCHSVSTSLPLSSDTYLAADNSFNIYILKRNYDDGITDEEKSQLITVGRMYTGERINCILNGSIVQLMSHDDTNTNLQHYNITDTVVQPTHIYCTVSGCIGVLAPLTKSQFQLLTQLEDYILNNIQSIGGFSHTEYKSFHIELQNKTITRSGFIDGDLIEQYLDLSNELQDKIANQCQVPRSELNTFIEQLTRIH